MNTARLPLLSFLLGLSFVTLLAPATSAQDYPNRPIRFIVGFPPGGSVDVLARAVANQATKTLGQPILVENRAGASTNAASDFVAKERPTAIPCWWRATASPSTQACSRIFRSIPPPASRR
jgi:tripartite-type tricarboxylate transporter receptor subunit TctC